MKFVRDQNDKEQPAEQELLLRYRQTGDIQLVGQLYAPYMPLVYGVCLKYLKDEDKCKDAVMQIFEQLVKKLRFHEVSNFKSWLHSVTRNHCLMILRASGRHDLLSLDDEFMENRTPVHLDIDDTREKELSLMEMCMEKLPDEQKVSIRLFYLEQQCYKDISDATGYDIKKVKSYIQNGKRNLKICIEKNREDE